MSNDDKLRQIAERLANTEIPAVVFTGAGMSTDSGLPDFRSKGGIWADVDPMELATTSAMMRDYDRFHEFYSYRFEQMKSAAPNQGHKILAEWERFGYLNCIITQNVDGLHEAAGSKKIYELHGSVGKVRCSSCGSASTQEAFMDKAPCPRCGNNLRPGVVLFGESLPVEALDASYEAAHEAGLFIVLGSSLQVSPANQLPIAAKRSGALLVICNRDITQLDHLADYRTDSGIGDFLASLTSLL